MDVLDDILGALALKGALYFRTDFSGPWAVEVPELGRAARFHLVIQGAVRVVIDGEAVELWPGDLILIPGGRSHILADPEAPVETAPPLETVLEDAGYDGAGVLSVGQGDPAAATQMICGHFTFREGADHPLLRALPDHLVFTAAARASSPFLDDMLRLATRRLFEGEVGSVAAATRLSEIVFIELLRSGVAAAPGLAHVMRGLSDPQIGKAIGLIHRRPEAPWTIESLGAEVGMSRSRFAARFADLIGVAPMTYLADWRMQRALAMLEGGGASIQEVAASTGYASQAAFTRAFAGRFGGPPSAWRRALAS